MTKKVRIENADNSIYSVVVQIWDKYYGPPPPADQGPDTLVKEIILKYPTEMTSDDCYITNTRYLMVKELPSG